MNYTDIISLIEKNTDKVEFADFGDGVSQQWIDLAESRLGVVFPPSYVWWLKNYSGGQINGNEIFSIYEVDFDEVVGGDIVYINELNQKNKISTIEQLTIQEDDFGEMYYIDLSQRREDGECPVYCHTTKKKFADTFLDFIGIKILE